MLHQFYTHFSLVLKSNEFFFWRNGTMTNCGGTRVNTAEWERFMSPPKLFGYQTLSCITSKKYHIIHGPHQYLKWVSDVYIQLPSGHWPSHSSPGGMLVMMITDADLLIHIATGKMDLTSQRVSLYSPDITYSHSLNQVTQKKQAFEGKTKNIYIFKTLKSLLLLLRVQNSWNFGRVVFRSNFSS